MTHRALEGDQNPYRVPILELLDRQGLVVADRGTGTLELACEETKGRSYISLGQGGGGDWRLVHCLAVVTDGQGKERVRWKLVGPDGPESLEANVAEASARAFLESPALNVLPDLVAVALGDQTRARDLASRLPVCGIDSPIAGIETLIDREKLDPAGRAAVAVHRGDVVGALREGVAAIPALQAFLGAAPSSTVRYRSAVLGLVGLAAPTRPEALLSLYKQVSHDDNLAVQVILGLAGRTAPALARRTAGSIPDGSEEHPSPQPLVALALGAIAGCSSARPPLPVTLKVKYTSRGKAPIVDLEPSLRPALLVAGLDAQSAAEPHGALEFDCREAAGPTFVHPTTAKTLTFTKVRCAMVVRAPTGKVLAQLSATSPVPRQLVVGKDESDLDAVARWQFLGSSGLALLGEVAALALGRDARAPWAAVLALIHSLDQAIGPLEAWLAPRALALPPAARAAWSLAHRRGAEAAALGEAALPAFWLLLTSSWGRVEPRPVFEIPEEDAATLVGRRLPIVRALGSIPGRAAAALALYLLRDLPVASTPGEHIFESDLAGGFRSGLLHPAAAEGALLAVLLRRIAQDPSAQAKPAVLRYASDTRPAVRKAAEEALAKL